jgi:hypothetical protein
MTGALATCFGFEVHSPLSFEYLREGTGQPLEIAERDGERAGPVGRLVLEWLPGPEVPYHGRLYANGTDGETRYSFWHGGAGWFFVEPGRIVLPPAREGFRREERLWGIPALLSFLARGDFPLHAAAVEVDGAAIVIAAPRTFGKTTLAAGFLQAGHRILTEDLACLRLSAEPAVVPGPAMLRLRLDVAERLELASARAVGRSDDRVHLALDPSGRGDCRPVPVRAVVLLKHSDDGLRLERVPPAEALRDLWAVSFRLPTPSDSARCFDGLVELAHHVPLWNLFHSLRLEDLPTAVELLTADV